MLRFLSILLFLCIPSLTFGESETKRYLYITTPDGAQKDGRSGTGMLVFDIDNGHKFVRRIDIPIFAEPSMIAYAPDKMMSIARQSLPQKAPLNHQGILLSRTLKAIYKAVDFRLRDGAKP